MENKNSMAICVVNPPINTSAEVSRDAREIFRERIGCTQYPNPKFSALATITSEEVSGDAKNAKEIVVAMPTITSAEVIGYAKTRPRIKKTTYEKTMHTFFIISSIVCVALTVHWRISRRWPISLVVNAVIALIFAIWVAMHDALIDYIKSEAATNGRDGDLTKSKQKFIEIVPGILAILFFISIICIILEMKITHII